MATKDSIDKALPNVDPEVVSQPEELTVTETDCIAMEIEEGGPSRIPKERKVKIQNDEYI